MTTQGRPGRGSPDRWTRFKFLQSLPLQLKKTKKVLGTGRVGEPRLRTRTKVLRCWRAREAAGGPTILTCWTPRGGGRGALSAPPGPPPRLPSCGAAAISCGRGARGARVRAPRGGRARPLCSWPRGLARTPRRRAGCVLRGSAAGRARRPPSTRALTALRKWGARAPPWRCARGWARKGLELRRGKLGVEPGASGRSQPVGARGLQLGWRGEAERPCVPRRGHQALVLTLHRAWSL